VRVVEDGLRAGGDGLVGEVERCRVLVNGDRSTGSVSGVDPEAWVRCAHWDRGCNWLVDADLPTGVCFADGFVRHVNGVITIDLAESLVLYRERQRIILKEPYRTMLGHLRHEVGHYYEMLLITGGALIDQARSFFGDERRNYQAALADYYAGRVPAHWEHDYISHYATAHPGEDWAETFAHYLHITGTLATIADSGLLLRADRVHFDLDADIDPRLHYGEGDFAALVHDWEGLSGVLNRVNHAMGKKALYPFRLNLPVVAKLGFVHHVVIAAADDNTANTASASHGT